MKTRKQRYFDRFLNIVIGSLISVFFIFHTPTSVYAQSEKFTPVITIINLIRGNELGHDNDDLVESLKAQYQVTQDSNVNATWLLQYGALDNSVMMNFVKNEMRGQEFGILFEIDRNFAKKSNVLYRGQGSWYFSDGLFFNAYDVAERKKLIDTAFQKFKTIFGYYPKTVGGWWIGGDSLTYMQEKYGITAALRAADQFDLDFYSLWGTPWNIPYLSTKSNQAIPARSYDESSKVVNLQWAIRDPLKGYDNPLYSLQDYSTKGYSPLYVNYLAGIFLQKPFNNLVIGLENGGTIDVFNKSYKTMLIKAKEISAERNARILLTKDYSREFLDQKKVFPAQTYFLSQDFDSPDQSFWYISENYRATIFKKGRNIYLVDIRDYSKKLDEDFHILPNTEKRLRINTPDIVESIRFPENRMLLGESDESLESIASGSAVTLSTGSLTIAQFFPDQIVLGKNNKTVQKTYDFIETKGFINLRFILYGMVFIYFIFCILKMRNIRLTIISFIPFVISLYFASLFLRNESVFLFDRKEIPLFSLLFFFRHMSVYETLIQIKIIPFILLIVIHFFAFSSSSSYKMKRFYYIYIVLIIFMYMNIPYFPLDKSTLMYVGVVSFCIMIFLGLIAYIVFLKLKSIKITMLLFFSIPVILGMLLSTMYLSRTKLVLTNFEISAIQKLIDLKKDGIYVEQYDNNVRPIYKAVKPLLYDNHAMLNVITSLRWRYVLRPDNHILELKDYNNQVIVIPKYLGSDLSPYEEGLHHLKKIFDNAQIQIFDRI